MPSSMTGASLQNAQRTRCAARVEVVVEDLGRNGHDAPARSGSARQNAMPSSQPRSAMSVRAK